MSLLERAGLERKIARSWLRRSDSDSLVPLVDRWKEVFVSMVFRVENNENWKSYLG